MAEPFCYHRRVHFAESDASGLAHFAAMPCWVEEAEHERARQAGLSMLADDHGWVRRALQIDYETPVRAGDEVTVELSVAASGRSSLTYAFRIAGPAGTVAHGRLTVVHVRRSADGVVSEPMPAAWRASLPPT